MAKRRAATEVEPVKPTGNLSIDLGVSSLVEFEQMGYLPSRPEVTLTPKSRAAVKRLALTLEQQQATLSDGSQVRNSTSKTIAWLCERLAEAV